MSSGEKTVKKTIKKVTVLNKELFENAGMQEKLAAALEKLKKEKPEHSMTKEELSPPAAPVPPVKPTSSEIKQLLKRKVEERKSVAAVPPPLMEIKKEVEKPSRRGTEPAKVPKKTADIKQKIQVRPAGASEPPSTPPHSSKQQSFQSNNPIPIVRNIRPIIKPEKTPVKPLITSTTIPIRSPSIGTLSPAPSSSTDEIIMQSPPNIPSEFYRYPSQMHFLENSPPTNIHPISISYAGNDPVLKNIPNTMILPMEQSFEPVPESFDEATRESLYSNEVNEDGEDGVNFLNNMFAGTSNQNSNDYSSTDEDDEMQQFDYGEGEEFYENSRGGVEYTIHEIEETKPARPIILEEKILADNEKFSADWVDKIVKTEVKTEPEGYNFYVQPEQHVPQPEASVDEPIAHSSKDLQNDIVATMEEPPVPTLSERQTSIPQEQTSIPEEPTFIPEEPTFIQEEPTPIPEEPINEPSSQSEEQPMDQDSEEQPITPTEEPSETIPSKETKSVPSRIRRSKPKVNLIQRNKPSLPPPRKSKVAPNQSKNLTTQITEEPPPPLAPLSKKTVTPTTTRSKDNTDNQPSFFEFFEAPTNQTKPSFFENSEISPHRKKVDTIDLTDPDDLPLIHIKKQKPVETKTPKRKKQPVQTNTITKYLSPPENKPKKSKSSYDSEEELTGFELNNQSKNPEELPVNYVIIENPTIEKPLEISNDFEEDVPIANLRRTEPTPPPLGECSRYPKKPKPLPKKPRMKKGTSTSDISMIEPVAPPAPIPSTPTTPCTPVAKTTPGATSTPSTDASGKNASRLNKTVHPYLLLVKNRSDLVNFPTEFQPVEVIDCKPGSVQCGFCGEVTFSNAWIPHLETHYGVGWKIDEPVENVSSYSIVLQKMISFFKTTLLSHVSCRMCGKKYKSGLGLLSHVETCGLDKLEKMVKCCYCKKSVNKSYLGCHLRVCNVLFDINFKQRMEAVNAHKAGKDIVLGNTGRIKRTSMIKAEGAIKKEKEDFDPDLFIRFPSAPRKGVFNKWRKDIKMKQKASCYFTGCDFKTSSLGDMKTHNASCTAISTLPMCCLKCDFSHAKIDVVREHVKENHRKDLIPDSDDSTFSEDSDDYNSSGADDNVTLEDESMSEGKPKLKKVKKKAPAKDRSLSATIDNPTPTKTTKPTENKYRKLADLSRTTDLVPLLDKYTSDFLKKHYSTTSLYKNFRPHYFVSATKLDPYLPNSKHSMLFSEISQSKGFNRFLGESKEIDQEWMQLERFQGMTLSESESLLFIGGPISAMAWVPLSEPSTTQYVAVAYRKDFSDHTLQKNPPPKKTMILIIEQSTIMESPPKILYGIKIENGPVHHLEFMPSGGYSKSMNRLGLLAVSNIETDVHVYSLPIACNIKMEKVEDNICDTSIDFKFLEILPSFTLVVDARKNFDISHEKNNQCMRVRWSKGKNHNIIAAGFANGAVAIWDIDEDPENLSRIYTNSSLKYVPSCYMAHMRNQIVGLDFHYDSHGPRWLAVCGITRIVNVYDIDDLSLPKIVSSDVSFNIMSSMEWPFLWELICYSSTDWFATYGNCITFSSPMALFARHVHKSRTLCGINDTSYNPWFNNFLSGADNGDIVVDFVKELNCPLDARTFSKDTCLIACTDLASLDSKPIPRKKASIIQMDDWKWFEDDYQNKFGILFGSLKNFNYNKDKHLKSAERQPMANLCRYLRINKAGANTNPHSNNIMAVGYENGFLKIFTMSRDLIRSAMD